MTARALATYQATKEGERWLGLITKSVTSATVLYEVFGFGKAGVPVYEVKNV